MTLPRRTAAGIETEADAARPPRAAVQAKGSAAARAGRLDRTAWAALLAPALLMLWSARAMWLTYSPTPFSDQWSELFAWREAVRTGWLQYLLTPHNEHRIVVPRLVFIADWRWFQGRDVLNLVAIGLTQLAGAAVFVQIARPWRAGAIARLGLALALCLVFSLTQWENLFWGFQVQFVGVYAFAAWALYAFCFASQDPQAVRWGAMAAAVALLALATFNMANGVLAGAVMLAVALVSRRGYAASAAAGFATLGLLALYLHGYQMSPGHTPLLVALQHPGRILTYIAIFLGNIWWPGRAPQAAVAGLAGLAATVVMVVVVARDRSRDPARAALLGLALFVAASAAMTSFARIHLGVGQALSSRYMTPTAYFWGAQALFWTLAAERAWGPKARTVLVGLVGLAVLRIVQLQFAGDTEVLTAHERVVLGSSALLGGVEDRDALLGLYPDLGMVHDLTAFMQASHISLFADPPVAAVGARFARTPAPPGSICRGAFDVVSPAPAPAAGVWRAQGWGWDVQARRSLSRVVVVDGAGQVLGVGLSGLRRPDVVRLVREVRSPAAGWVASINRGAGGQVIAYGITAAGAACELGRKGWPR